IPSSVITIENKSSTDWTFIECPNVVLHVTCGTVGWNYARSKGLAHSDTHNYANSRVVAPTCTAQGYTVYSCVCGASYRSNYTNALGHSYGTTVVPPTCTEQGYTTHTCVVCGASYVDNYTEPTGHSLGEWYLHKAPTTSEAGEERRDCANCDYYESREVPAYKVGDINRDGKVNTIDANYARRYAAGLLTLDAGQKLAGDVNLDGEVNVMDSAIIRRYVVKYITSLPYTG
ncbi:MAG: dockerin type I repeat-containing protein, partial [Oscillospiraceae bacterium]|nr:dockerin type I repeat-containing protein [Oscillospiraceae bacterium]